MILLKLYYHIICCIKTFFYKLIYRERFSMPLNTTFRTNFHLIIEDQGKISIGKHCFFNNYCTLASRLNITIGDGSIFGENVKIYDHNHCYKNKNIPIKNQGYTAAPIIIGKHCWIANNVIILKGVTIGDNCVIGAGCIIYKDIPSGSIIMNKQQYQYLNDALTGTL